MERNEASQLNISQSRSRIADWFTIVAGSIVVVQVLVGALVLLLQTDVELLPVQARALAVLVTVITGTFFFIAQLRAAIYFEEKGNIGRSIIFFIFSSFIGIGLFSPLDILMVVSFLPSNEPMVLWITLPVLFWLIATILSIFFVFPPSKYSYTWLTG